MCCKLPRIPVLDKPAGEWCRHCTPGVGCNIYDERPQMCREFFCQWIENTSLALRRTFLEPALRRG